MSSETKVLGRITSIKKTSTHYLIQYGTKESANLNILNDHVFKFNMSPKGKFQEHPATNRPEHAAKITAKAIADYGTQAFEKSTIVLTNEIYSIETADVKINFDTGSAKMTVIDKRTNKVVLKEKEPLSYGNKSVKQILYTDNDEFFFGGGMQNGRIAHTRKEIEIKNTNGWNDGDVSSPCPFYWSTNGYGVLRNTWQPGTYDFGAKTPGQIETVHHVTDFDAFFFVNHNPKDILGDYFELTGQPILLPEYAFYAGHSNTFNKHYWVEVPAKTSGAILFEDSKYYKKFTHKELEGRSGVLETLNGENDNYQFSARAMIDRYKMHNMPLGWFIPNDGYGSGYGQTDSFEGDLENLMEFQHYAKEDGIETALWTESDLVPADPGHPKKGERDFAREVQEAGVKALKCDISWIGQGYSHSMSRVEIATKLFNKACKNKGRPVIITTRGWAGIQRYSGIWSGNQEGGKWENIRFHIPTFIGAGLSGLPVVGSDIDGIFSGGEKEINIREFQWKSFTPIQLNMDGWGSHPKTPFSFDYEATSINRAYLKMKSMLMPYNYTIGYESTQGLPMVRAMFLEFPHEISAYADESLYQYMWGPSILVAPVYKPEKSPSDETIRSGIYLPDANQVWIDLLTGAKYQGGRIYNTIKVPVWKLPLFVRDGAILPVTKANNYPNEIKRHERMFLIYPNDTSSFEVYEDDGISSDYLRKLFAKTKITVIGPKTNKEGDLKIHINKTKGSYENMVRERSTFLKIQASKDVDDITVTINGQTHQMNKVSTCEEFKKGADVYYFTEKHATNKYLIEFGKDELYQGFLLVKIGNTRVIDDDIVIKVRGYANIGHINGTRKLDNSISAPGLFTVPDKYLTSTSVTLEWQAIENANYELEKDGIIYSNITGNTYTFDGLMPGTQHSFKIRTITETRISKWSYTILAKTNAPTMILKGVKATCNVPSQPSEEIEKLTNDNLDDLWHTAYNRSGEADIGKGKVIILNFDIQNVQNIQKVEYIPRKENVGNGMFSQVKYRISSDKQEWTEFSDIITWENNNSPKIIELHGQEMRYMELHVLDSVGGYGSGRAMRFYALIE